MLVSTIVDKFCITFFVFGLTILIFPIFGFVTASVDLNKRVKY
jgi:hypothetical protein